MVSEMRQGFRATEEADTSKALKRLAYGALTANEGEFVRQTGVELFEKHLGDSTASSTETPRTSVPSSTSSQPLGGSPSMASEDRAAPSLAKKVQIFYFGQDENAVMTDFSAGGGFI